MGECNQLSTPMVNVPLPREEINSPLLNAMEQSNFRSLVGRLLWACLYTRPDLQFAVSKLSSKVACPTEGDMKLPKKCLRYIKGMLNSRLVFKRNTGVKMGRVGCSDASHGNEERRTSQNRHIFLWNGTTSYGIPEGRSPSQSPLIKQKFMDSVKPLGRPSS